MANIVKGGEEKQDCLNFSAQLHPIFYKHYDYKQAINYG